MPLAGFYSEHTKNARHDKDSRQEEELSGIEVEERKATWVQDGSNYRLANASIMKSEHRIAPNHKKHNESDQQDSLQGGHSEQGFQNDLQRLQTFIHAAQRLN
jgi:hypothetical protein